MFRSLIVGIAALTFCSFALAQNANGILDGRVTDASGSSIPGAKVTVENQDTSVKKEYTTNSEGRFYQGQVLIGTYRVTVEKAGFQKYVESNVRVDVAQTVTLDIPLKVGDVATTVEIIASAAQLTTESSSVSTVIGSKAIPQWCLGMVWRHALALGVHDAKIKLRDGVVLLRRFAIPFDCLGVVSQQALATLVHDAEVELRVSVPLLGQRMPEPERCCIVAALIRGNSIL